MFLSFIVPVYNAEAYLNECLDSLLNQDIPSEEYEVICVNDGSTDGSRGILEAFGARYPNLILINQANSGVSTARNRGMKAARGTFLWFVDADDFILPGILGALRTAARETPCDRILLGGYQFTDALTPAEAEQSRREELPINVPGPDAVVWRSLLRREFLLQQELSFRYPELTHGEDGLFMYELSQCAPVTVTVNRVLYFYRVHGGSAETAVSMENQLKKLRSHIAITRIMLDYYASGRKDPATANRLMSSLWLSLYVTSKFPRKEAAHVLKELREAGLFPFRRIPECTLTRSYLTERQGPAGQILDWICLHLHTRWGFSLCWVLQQLLSMSRRRIHT